jgi:trans-aconitate methyltransferase
MMEVMATTGGNAAHWDHAYAQGDRTRSWYQTQPTMSLRMLELAGAQPRDSLIDVGGGAAPLVDALLEQGFRDLTVLDVSEAGLTTAQHRLGPAAELVTWVQADVTRWRPPRRYDLWHDRAVFHFLTTHTDQQRYLDTLAAALLPGGHAIIGTFANDGPERCSGLPVARYTPTPSLSCYVPA